MFLTFQAFMSLFKCFGGLKWNFKSHVCGKLFPDRYDTAYDLKLISSALIVLSVFVVSG